MTLNPRQLEAVEHHEGPLLILAGAGSGKTRVLVQRIARLLESGRAQPWEILAVTFTNKAAKELVARCQEMVGPAAKDLWAGTFHGTAARLLRRHADELGYTSSFTIFDMDDQMKLLKQLVADANLDDSIFRADAIRSVIDQAKNEARSPEQVRNTAADTFTIEAGKIYERYQERLVRMNAMDFGDLIVNALHLLEGDGNTARRYRARFRYVMVDEYQDTNRAQYRIVHSVAAGHGNLCVVGDDDQSIYGWRGADRRNILGFERDWPGALVVRLEQNYRSSSNIIEAAAAVIGHNSERHDKRMWTAAEPGPKITQYTATDERDEARWIASEIEQLGSRRSGAAVFYRTNAQSRAIEEEFVRRGLPYVIVGATRFYERREVKDLLAYLRFVNNPADDLALERIINVPARGVGKVTWERTKAYAAQSDRSVWETLNDEQVVRALPAAARKRLTTFCQLATGWLASPVVSVGELTRRIIDETGYIAWLEARPEDDPVGRTENIQELVTVATGWDEDFSSALAERDPEDPELTPLAGFLERVALTADIDGYQARERAITMMTVHNSKGLEFPYAFVAGMEEGIFPHARSTDEEGEGIEEERRLCYVAMTRAMTRLCVTHARRRHVFGNTQYNFASRFLDEIPPSLIRRERSASEDGERGSSGFGRRRGAAPAFDEAAQAAPRPAPPGNGSYQPGMKVAHPMFGVGTVRRSDGEGEAEKITVQFQRVGLKKLVARFARLEIV
ncbi:MAG: DNA helicase-2/ATP-dependent DNA helicase PcrA [Hyphomicrobiaceae bacterium]|jgi:DNA helicase-2/ATP-dependent DNA helicase PcrA